MGASEITWAGLALVFALLVVPLVAFFVLKVRLTRSMLWSVFRMSVQLALVGVFLEYLFELDSGAVNVAWLLLMAAFAAFSTVGSTGLRYRLFLLPSFVSLAVSSVLILLFFNGPVVGLTDILDAKYLIAVGGMLLGNSLGGNIIGLGDFYRGVRRNENRYLYSLSLGATRYEALAPYLRRSVTAALKPALANMATMGLVFLPGMMTGQIISGESPLLAIKYQVAIVIAIFACVVASVTLTTLATAWLSFDEFDILKDVFRPQGKGPASAARRLLRRATT